MSGCSRSRFPSARRADAREAASPRSSPQAARCEGRGAQERGRAAGRSGQADLALLAIALIFIAFLGIFVSFLIRTDIAEFQRTHEIVLLQEERGGLLRTTLASGDRRTLSQQAADTAAGADLGPRWKEVLDAMKARLGLVGYAVTISANGASALSSGPAPAAVRAYSAELPLPGGRGERGLVILEVW